MIFLPFFLILLISQSTVVSAMEKALVMPTIVTPETEKLYKNYNSLSTIAVKKYIDKGANVNYTPHKEKPTLLMYSIRRSIDDVKLLLESGANVNKKVNQRTALHWAIEEDNLKKVQLLLKYNPINLCTGYALTRENVNIIELIIAKEKNPLVFMKAIIPSIIEEKLSFNIIKVFLDKDLFDEAMFIPLLDKIIAEPFNDSCMNLFILFCKYNKFSQEALTLARDLIPSVATKALFNTLETEFNTETLQEHMATKRLERRLLRIIALLKKNEPKRDEPAHEKITFYPHISTI